MPDMPVNKVVDPKKNNRKKWRAEEEERNKGSQPPPPPPKKAGPFPERPKFFQLLTNGLPHRLVIDVLRQASKSSVVRRQFSKAEILIQEAVLLAREIYGEQHLKVPTGDRCYDI
jgi:hypothetical protein